MKQRSFGSVEAMICSCEQQLGLDISIHDHVGIFKSADGQPLLVNRHIHHHHYCQLQRRQSIHHCLSHCKDAVEAQAADPQPFVSACWKGLREIIIPLHRYDLHVATCYVGGWRQQRPPALPDDVSHQEQLRQALTQVALLPDAEYIYHLTALMQTWCDGLLDCCEALQGMQAHPGNRADAIRAFLHRNANRPIRLQDLADELGCSASRAGQLCRSELGQNFQQLLLSERIQRAGVLLRASPATIAEIAERCGFGDVYYFSRAFKKATGLPPGTYRKQKVSHGGTAARRV